MMQQTNNKYEGKLTPWPHQSEALARMKGMRAFALFMYMRCVDGDTEYLSPTGWQKISSYTGGLVAEFRLDGTAHFVEPKQFIKAPVDKFWHFRSNGGTDQVLSHNHRILLCGGWHTSNPQHVIGWGRIVGPVPKGYRTIERPYSDFWKEISPAEIKERYTTPIPSGRVPLTFWLHHDKKIPLTDDEIRLQVAFHADGSFGTRDLSKIKRRNGVIRVKKQYKKERMRELLKAVGREWREKAIADGFSVFIFRPPLVSKTYTSMWWEADYHQRCIIADEAFKWNGKTLPHRSDARIYSSIHEQDADFIQFCLASTGQRAMRSAKRQGEGTFAVWATGYGRSGNLCQMPIMKEYKGQHNGFMYSFAVPSTYLVLRRNGKIFITGNTGKSKCVLDDFGQMELEGKVKDLLVIAPHGAYKTWETAIDDHVAAALRQRLVILTWDSGKSGTVKFKEGANYFLALRDRPRVLIMNVEALSTVKTAREFCIKFLHDRSKSMIVIDESTVIKSQKAKRTKFITQTLAPLAEWKRILSGLPTPQSPLDFFTQFWFLDPRILGFRSFWTFREHYAEMKITHLGHQRQFKQVVGFKNLDELHRKIERFSHRVPFRPLHPSTYSIREVPLTKEQERLYKEMKQFATAQLSATEHVTATVVIAQILRLHQIVCGYTNDEQGKEHAIPEHRIETLLELLEDYSGKAVIWCCYDYNIRKVSEALLKAYGERSVARFWGGNTSTREEEQQKFKDDPQCRFIVGTPSAGRFGRDWREADLVIYYSCSNDLEHRDQSEMRVQGIGKDRPVDYVDLVAPGTVEPKILHALRKKIDLNTVITGDSWRDWVV